MQSSPNVIPLHQTQFSVKSPPIKPRNGDVRPREYLTKQEVDGMIKQARKGRHGHRDATLILVMYRHGCGYKLINDGADVRTVQQYLGHASINSTVIYTKLDSRRFDGLWRD